MNIYLKQKAFSIKEKFTVYDENENPIYTGEGKVFSIHNYHYIYDLKGEEVATIHRKIIAIMPKIFIERPHGQMHEMKGKLAFAHDVFEIATLGWKVTGRFLDHDYVITEGDKEIVTVHEKWLAWGNTFEISIAEGVDEIMALAVVLCIDVMHEQEAESDSTFDVSNNNNN